MKKIILITFIVIGICAGNLMARQATWGDLYNSYYATFGDGFISINDQRSNDYQYLYYKKWNPEFYNQIISIVMKALEVSGSNTLIYYIAIDDDGNHKIVNIHIIKK